MTGRVVSTNKSTKIVMKPVEEQQVDSVTIELTLSKAEAEHLAKFCYAIGGDAYYSLRRVFSDRKGSILQLLAKAGITPAKEESWTTGEPSNGIIFKDANELWEFSK